LQLRLLHWTATLVVLVETTAVAGRATRLPIVHSIIPCIATAATIITVVIISVIVAIVVVVAYDPGSRAPPSSLPAGAIRPPLLVLLVRVLPALLLLIP
jgi:hypothetical protein